MEQLEPLLATMREIAAKYDVPVSAVALNWVIAKGAIPLGGARNRQQAEQVRSRIGGGTNEMLICSKLECQGFDIHVDARRSCAALFEILQGKDVSISVEREDMADIP